MAKGKHHISHNATHAAKRPTGDPAHQGSSEMLYGGHTVSAALANPARRPRHLWTTENQAQILQKNGIKTHCPHDILTVRAISRLLPSGAVHQGMALAAAPLPEAALDDIDPASPLVLALDQITDPQNVGAILRTAAIFGVSAVVMTSRNAPSQSGVLAKAASGALERVNPVRVPNLARALGTLSDRGRQIVGLEYTGSTPLAGLPSFVRDVPLVLVLGAEGRGLRQLTRTRCDHLVSISPSAGTADFTSLNVSNATAIALYELTRG